MSVNDVLDAIMSRTLFGMAPVYIHVLEEKRKVFGDIPPNLKNAFVGREDISDDIRQYSEENALLQQPRKCPTSGYHAASILLSTSVIRWYEQHGLVVTKINGVPEYEASTCFHPFDETLSNSRRKAKTQTTP